MYMSAFQLKWVTSVELDCRMCVCPLTFLHHACSHSELGGVIGSSVASGLPGLLPSHNQLLPLLDGHVSLYILTVHLSLGYSLRKNVTIEDNFM